MFERLGKPSRPIVFTFNGTSVEAQAGDTVATALLAAGHRSFRETPVSGAARGPFCMMGACYDCLVEIDSETLQACMVQVSEGLVVTSPRRHAKFGGEV